MKSLYKALADFQAEVPNIYKNAKGYNYKFADLGEINDVIKPLLNKHGLGYSQPLAGTSVKTILYHIESGETLESTVDIPQGVKLNSMNDFQVMGSAITYLRRYSLSSMLGLITDEDADAAGEQLKATRKANTDTTTDGGTQEILARAKDKINKELEAHNYITDGAKQAFIRASISKTTIDTIDDCDIVIDALENEKSDE
jgi:hypothetical protein